MTKQPASGAMVARRIWDPKAAGSSPASPTTSKTCRWCGHVLPLHYFYRHPEGRDGHVNTCKACTLKRAKENYALFAASRDQVGSGAIRDARNAVDRMTTEQLKASAVKLELLRRYLRRRIRMLTRVPKESRDPVTNGEIHAFGCVLRRAHRIDRYTT